MEKYFFKMQLISEELWIMGHAQKVMPVYLWSYQFKLEDSITSLDCIVNKDCSMP